MIRSITSTLHQGTGTGLRATLLDAAPHENKINGIIRPVFCVGGDGKAVYLVGKKTSDDSSRTSSFFREEYNLNYRIATQSIPQVSFWDGVVMGGGV
ncbi:hypothetical protein HJC23_013652 [Cyclotella cryptica]|uniref:3-hydroxyisobutyryl-CoA hydrolase n=1 Tax=Cyclotella cryptica TaxID=29204 RepID=A0ABD3QV87_9STRA|eukprot:CCRYP_001474-RA/>CCRYP_001474-RA protein AED:0.47 eAED:0.47 QI:0/-1/0/1/-1/1/1/0/96